MKKFLLLTTVFCLANFSRALAADLTPSQSEFFENKIRPLLADNCYKCHIQSAYLKATKSPRLKTAATTITPFPRPRVCALSTHQPKPQLARQEATISQTMTTSPQP